MSDGVRRFERITGDVDAINLKANEVLAETRPLILAGWKVYKELVVLLETGRSRFVVSIELHPTEGKEPVSREKWGGVFNE